MWLALSKIPSGFADAQPFAASFHCFLPMYLYQWFLESDFLFFLWLIYCFLCTTICLYTCLSITYTPGLQVGRKRVPLQLKLELQKVGESPSEVGIEHGSFENNLLTVEPSLQYINFLLYFYENIICLITILNCYLWILSHLDALEL